MKYLLFLTLLLPVFSQAQTNWDEYHFATKGYAQVLEGTGSMMDDYIVKKDTPKQFSYGTMTFCQLIDTDAEKIACGIIIIKKPDTQTRYLCLPQPGTAREIINQCIGDYQAAFPGYKGGISDEGLNQLFGLTMAVFKGK